MKEFLQILLVVSFMVFMCIGGVMLTYYMGSLFGPIGVALTFGIVVSLISTIIIYANV